VPARAAAGADDALFIPTLIITSHLFDPDVAGDQFTLASLRPTWLRALVRTLSVAVASIPGREYLFATPVKVMAVFWALLCAECVSGRSSAPDPAGGAYSAPPDP